jgi:8-oxo-dGTP pyrophosphatase MutT (NUDIX family)
MCAYVLLEKDSKYFMLRRFNTGHFDSCYGLPSGKVDDGEDVLTAAVRETFEETGVRINPADLKFVHFNHDRQLSSPLGPNWADVYFVCSKWQGEPYNAEAHKADDYAWIDIDDTDKQIVPYTLMALKAIQNQQSFAISGEWPALQQAA